MVRSSVRGLLLLSVFGLLGAPAAVAQMASTPTAINETQGATTGLGSSHRFATEAEAAAHCGSDTIVWSASPDLIYVLPNAPSYAKGKGFYACKQEADAAGFHAAAN